MEVNFREQAMKLSASRMEQIRVLQGICAEVNMLQAKCDSHMQEAYNELLEMLEFTLQHAWEIHEDKNYHTWWMRSSECTCPKMDNMDAWGTNCRIHAEDCPVHGKEVHKSTKAPQPKKEEGVASNKGSKGLKKAVKTIKNRTDEIWGSTENILKSWFGDIGTSWMSNTVKQTGKGYHNIRDSKGRFCKK